MGLIAFYRLADNRLMERLGELETFPTISVRDQNYRATCKSCALMPLMPYRETKRQGK